MAPIQLRPGRVSRGWNNFSPEQSNQHEAGVLPIRNEFHVSMDPSLLRQSKDWNNLSRPSFLKNNSREQLIEEANQAVGHAQEAGRVKAMTAKSHVQTEARSEVNQVIHSG